MCPIVGLAVYHTCLAATLPSLPRLPQLPHCLTASLPRRLPPLSGCLPPSPREADSGVVYVVVTKKRPKGKTSKTSNQSNQAIRTINQNMHAHAVIRTLQQVSHFFIVVVLVVVVVAAAADGDRALVRRIGSTQQHSSTAGRSFVVLLQSTVYTVQ